MKVFNYLVINLLGKYTFYNFGIGIFVFFIFLTPLANKHPSHSNVVLVRIHYGTK